MIQQALNKSLMSSTPRFVLVARADLAQEVLPLGEFCIVLYIYSWIDFLFKKKLLKKQIR